MRVANVLTQRPDTTNLQRHPETSRNRLQGIATSERPALSLSRALSVIEDPVVGSIESLLE